MDQKARAARQAKIHVELNAIGVIGERLQNDLMSARCARHLGEAHGPGDRGFDGLLGGGRVSEWRSQCQHAVVGSQQHEIRRVLLKRIAVPRQPRLRLLVLRDGDVEHKAEAEGGTIRHPKDGGGARRHHEEPHLR